MCMFSFVCDVLNMAGGGCRCIGENIGRSSREVYERHTIQDLATMSITKSIHLEHFANSNIEDLAAISVFISMGSPLRALCCNLSVKHNMWLAAEASIEHMDPPTNSDSSLEYMDHQRLSTEYWALILRGEKDALVR